MEIQPYVLTANLYNRRFENFRRKILYMSYKLEPQTPKQIKVFLKDKSCLTT